MKKRNWMRTGKQVGCLAAVLMTGAAGVWQTYSYFMEKEEAVNVFTVGDFDISLKESEWNPADGDGVNLYPGYTVYKNPTVKNVTDATTGVQPCYLQMRMKIKDEDGKMVTDQEVLNMVRQTIRYDDTYNGSWDTTGEGKKLRQGRIPGYSEKELAMLPMVNPNFQEVDTGNLGEYLFQYQGGKNGIMDIDEEAVLFTDVAIPIEWGVKEIKKAGRFQIQVTAEAIQANGFASAGDAFQVLGESVEKGALDEQG
ncbi:MAG: hypothetical protein PUK68_11350 [Lachnospiraceae bacterium]|nr:hypothetical protein [Lachnospiraceae bacterium]